MNKFKKNLISRLAVIAILGPTQMILAQAETDHRPSAFEIGLVIGAIRELNQDADNFFTEFDRAVELGSQSAVDLLIASQNLNPQDSQTLRQAAQFGIALSQIEGKFGEWTGRVGIAFLKEAFKQPTWQRGSPHPRYPNVIALDDEGNWAPSSGYSWANPYDQSDWTVIPRDTNRSSFNTTLREISFRVSYGGGDGVNIRSEPGGFDIIATAYKASGTSFAVLSSKPYYVRNIPWVKVRFSGWMAKRNLRNGDINVGILQEGLGYVKWDGRGNPSDNFVAMRTLGSEPKRIAKVYHSTTIQLGESKLDGNYEWVWAEFVGWAAVTSPRGTVLIGPR